MPPKQKPVTIPGEQAAYLLQAAKAALAGLRDKADVLATLVRVLERKP